MSNAKKDKTLDEILDCDSCEDLHRCESENWQICPHDQVEGEYTDEQIKDMVHTVFGWFVMSRNKYTREEVENLRPDVIRHLADLSDLVDGDCMPIAWDGTYYEDGYSEADIILRGALDEEETKDSETN
jgi:hypothetical protein